MKTLVIKEIRLLAPAWAACLIVALIPTLVVWMAKRAGFDESDLPFGLFWVLAMVVLTNLGVSSMGRELDLGTFSQMLAQPSARIQTWHLKTGLLFAALLTVIVIFWTSPPSHAIRNIDGALPAICGFAVACLAGGLWSTLLVRNTTAAFWMSLVATCGLLVLFQVLLEFNLLPFIEDTIASRTSGFRGMAVTFLSYAVICIVCARRYFMRVQDHQPFAGSVTLTLPRFASTGAHVERKTGQHGILKTLIFKELRLQQINLLAVALFAAIQLILIWVQYHSHETWAISPSIFKQSIWGLSTLAVWLFVPLLAAAIAVAEERKMGTLEVQLCLPVTRRTQYFTKLAVVLFVGIGLGAVLPLLLNIFGNTLEVFSDKGISISNSLDGWCEISAGIALLTFYASTGTRTTLSAVGTGIAFIVATYFLMVLPKALNHLSGTLIYIIGIPVMSCVLIGLGYRNFKRLAQSNVWIHNLGTIFTSLLLVCVATSLVYHRAWEAVITIEPRHGSPRFTRANPPKLGTFWEGAKAFILLPDGRIWASEEVPRSAKGGIRIDSLMPIMMVKEESAPRMTAGAFIGHGGWKQMEVSLVEAAAIADDGSLWSLSTITSQYIPPTRQPIRLEPGTNWKHLVAGGEHFLALKQDGTLWGWGGSHNGEVIDTTMWYLRQPVQIGTDTNWAACFAGPSVSIGIKTDGSAWCWGTVSMGTPTIRVNFHQKKPIRVNLPFNPTDLISLSGRQWECDFYLKDGSRGRVTFVKAKSDFPDLDFKPIEAAIHYFGRFDGRMGQKFNGLNTAGWFFLTADGSLFRENGQTKISNYSDWMAISGQEYVTGLAADGTLCVWDSPIRNRVYPSQGLLFAASRWPVSSLNIFAKPTP